MNDLYYAEWFVLYLEWFALRWMICTTLKDLYNVELFLLRWKICTTLNHLYCVERFVLRWIICTALKDLYYVEWFGVRWNICTTLNPLDYNILLSIGFLMSARCAYSRKYSKIFYTNLCLRHYHLKLLKFPIHGNTFFVYGSGEIFPWLMTWWFANV